MEQISLIGVLQKHQAGFHPVVPFNPESDKLRLFDFTTNNTSLSAAEIADTERFARYIISELETSGARYGIGGYAEHRNLYARSKHFSGDDDEPRRLHLGTDIWGPAGTRVMAPIDGIVHSFAFNNNDSDYGATIILTHILDGISFHSLYGHLSLNSLKNLSEGKRVRKGEVISEFGMRFENGNWPPHLHFQLIRDMQNRSGDFPGVCKFSEREQWLNNCPDPDLVLQMNKYVR
jgi:murein DD-endopeptidase MepM/ murein hydrolase activator NlpD